MAENVERANWPMPAKVALNAAQMPLRTARKVEEVFQKYTPNAISALTAAAIQPMMGMLIIATLTARQAVEAVAEKIPNEVEAVAAKVTEVAPPVIRERMSAPTLLRALKIPTVAKRSTARVARVILMRKPLEANCPVMSSRFIRAVCQRAANIAPRTPFNTEAKRKAVNPRIATVTEFIPPQSIVNSGRSWDSGTRVVVSVLAQREKSPVA